MKKRDILLDFTSLLDVTLIVIFFFVLFSHLDSQANKARTDEKVQELESAIEEAEEREFDADKLAKQLEEEIETVREANERTAYNINEMLSFNRNENLKIVLDMGNSNWGLRIIHKEDLIEQIVQKSDVSVDLLRIIQEIGIENDQTIFCDFTYDGSEPGTRSAYKIIVDGLGKLKKEYKYLYISETDLSIGKEE
ncbi:MAG: hypothetical protein E7307_08440 [Butyrivibrio sp.]|nr:hypothetical protein [Butyrivibrio sp.]